MALSYIQCARSRAFIDDMPRVERLMPRRLRLPILMLIIRYTLFSRDYYASLLLRSLRDYERAATLLFIGMFMLLLR